MSFLGLLAILAALAAPSSSPAPAKMELNARWLLLPHVAIHISGRLTSQGQPLAGELVTVATAGRVIGRPRTRANGAFGVHFQVVSLTRWHAAGTRRALIHRYRSITASFHGTDGVRPARVRVVVEPAHDG